VSRTIKGLREKKIVTSDGIKIALEKDPFKWKVTWRGNKIYLRRYKKLPEMVYTKDKRKERNLDEQSSSGSKSLKDNQEEMNWNKPSDNDDGLPEIDIDSRQEIKAKIVRPEKQRRISTEARLVFDLFGVDCYKRLHIRKQEAEAAEFLAEAHDLETLKRAVAYVEENRDNQFCPQIFSPYELRTKWPQLKAFKEKHG
jgi:hypothetical protein